MVEQEIRGANLSGLRTLSPTDQTLIREQLAPRVAVGLQPVVQPSGSMRLILTGYINNFLNVHNPYVTLSSYFLLLTYIDMTVCQYCYGGCLFIGIVA